MLGVNLLGVSLLGVKGINQRCLVVNWVVRSGDEFRWFDFRDGFSARFPVEQVDENSPLKFFMKSCFEFIEDIQMFVVTCCQNRLVVARRMILQADFYRSRHY